MKCQAWNCDVLALDSGDLCDPHQEREDEGEVLTRKRNTHEPKYTGLISVKDAVAAARKERDERIAARRAKDEQRRQATP